MGTESLSDYAAALKEYYGYDVMKQLVLEGDPFYAMVKKEGGGGDGIPVPLQYADAAAFSGTLSTAQTNAATGGKAQFLLVPNSFPDYYSVGKIARKLVLGADSNVKTFLNAATNKVDSAFRVMARNTQIHLYGDGSAALGQIATSGISTTNITLTNEEDSVNFQQGMKLQLASTKTGGAVESGTVTVSKVNRKTGVITCTANVTSGIATAADDMYIYIEGTYDNAVQGLSSWLPSSDPSGSDSFFSVNRSVDRVTLAGNPFNASGMLLYEALLDACYELNNYGGGKVTHAFCHGSKFNRLVKEMEAKSRNFRNVSTSIPVSKGSKVTVGFDGVQIVTAAGTFELYPSRFCPINSCFPVDMSTWKLWHIGKELVDIEGRDSDRGMLVDGANDAYEARVISYPELACDAPGHNGHIYNFGA